MYYYKNEGGIYYTDDSVYDSELLYYRFPSVSAENVVRIGFQFTNALSDIVYLPDVYDYYFLVTLYSITGVENFSFAPNRFNVLVYDCDYAKNYVLSDVNYYHHDLSNAYTGFTLTGKLPELGSTSLGYLEIHDDNGGTVPASDMYMRIQVLQVDKNSTSSDISLLSEKLDDINNSINQQGSNIHEVVSNLQQTIEDQYSVSEEENFGVEDIVDQVNEKAGVLSFGTDTLVNFLDLFDAANATNTKLTFPGFSMNIQGVNYQVWPDYHYDLSELENQFGALIEVVRWGCVMVVWLAVLNYLVKAYDTIFGR